MPEISMKQSNVPNIDVLLDENHNIIFRCVDCQTFLMPEMIRILKRPVRDQNGVGTWDTVELCPVCYPAKIDITNPNQFPHSTFITLSREEYEITRQYEKAGLLSPIKNEGLKSNLIEVVH